MESPVKTSKSPANTNDHLMEITDIPVLNSNMSSPDQENFFPIAVNASSTPYDNGASSQSGPEEREFEEYTEQCISPTPARIGRSRTPPVSPGTRKKLMKLPRPDQDQDLHDEPDFNYKPSFVAQKLHGLGLSEVDSQAIADTPYEGSRLIVGHHPGQYHYVPEQFVEGDLNEQGNLDFNQADEDEINGIVPTSQSTKDKEPVPGIIWPSEGQFDHPPVDAGPFDLAIPQFAHTPVSDPVDLTAPPIAVSVEENPTSLTWYDGNKRTQKSRISGRGLDRSRSALSIQDLKERGLISGFNKPAEAKKKAKKEKSKAATGEKGTNGASGAVRDRINKFENLQNSQTQPGDSGKNRSQMNFSLPNVSQIRFGPPPVHPTPEVSQTNSSHTLNTSHNQDEYLKLDPHPQHIIRLEVVFYNGGGTGAGSFTSLDYRNVPSVEPLEKSRSTIDEDNPTGMEMEKKKENERERENQRMELLRQEKSTMDMEKHQKLQEQLTTKLEQLKAATKELKDLKLQTEKLDIMQDNPGNSGFFHTMPTPVSTRSSSKARSASQASHSSSTYDMNNSTLWKTCLSVSDVLSRITGTGDNHRFEITPEIFLFLIFLVLGLLAGGIFRITRDIRGLNEDILIITKEWARIDKMLGEQPLFGAYYSAGKMQSWRQSLARVLS